MILTTNSKTILSLDFSRNDTCYQICSYCYVDKLERLYPAYAAKIKNNSKLVKENPALFAKNLNNEYKKLLASKAKKYKLVGKLPLRVYGSGDFIPEHYKFMELLNFNFYIISKNLTTSKLVPYIDMLLKLENLSSIVLSFDKDNISNYKNIIPYIGHKKIQLSYTGKSNEIKHILSLKKYVFGITFNTDKNYKAKNIMKQIKEQCPCDSGILKHDGSCAVCSKCYKPSSNVLKYKFDKLTVH